VEAGVLKIENEKVYINGIELLFPYRTEKLSPLWPMVLHNNAGE
jgi:hypothetical protein